MNVVEFLVCVPVVTMFVFGIYDVNRRIENQQTVSIAARNTALLGEAFTQARLNENVKKQFEVQGQILDKSERDDVLQDFHVSVTGGKRLGDEGFKAERIDAATGFNTGTNGAAGSSFDTLSQKTGQVGVKLADWMSKFQAVGEGVLVLIPDRMRSASVETQAAGHTNAIQRTFGAMTSVVTGNAGDRQDVLKIERRFGQKVYFRQENGYHPNGHNGFVAAGIILGAPKKAWGGGSDFGDSVDEIQPRCMTRLYGSDECGSGGSHEFHSHVIKVASAKLVVITILHVLEKIPWTAAVAKAAVKIIQTTTGIALKAADVMVTGADVISTVSDTLDSAIPSFNPSFGKDLKDSSIAKDFTDDLSPKTLGKMGK